MMVRGAYHVNAEESLCTRDIAPWGCAYGSMLAKKGSLYSTRGFKWPAWGYGSFLGRQSNLDFLA